MSEKIEMNLAGTIFHLDEDEIKSIEGYLNKVKAYFSMSEDLEKIIADREFRISTILQREGSKVLGEATIFNEDKEVIERDSNLSIDYNN